MTKQSKPRGGNDEPHAHGLPLWRSHASGPAGHASLPRSYAALPHARRKKHGPGWGLERSRRARWKHDRDGALLRGALADLSKVDDDQLVRCWGVNLQKSDSNGALEIATSVGVVELEIAHENEHFLEGTVTVAVGENDVAVGVVTLVAPEDER